MFVDSVTIKVMAGDGGDGVASFRREKYVPKGGPDGGDGGNGGDVTIESGDDVVSLAHLAGKKMLQAGNGGSGEAKKKKGAGGQPLIIHVPPGTLVTDMDSGLVIKTLNRSGDRACVAEGGRGGRGNVRFATAEDQKPDRRERGVKGRTRRLRLDCALPCDVALVGPPNSGRSSLLAALTCARPEVADYPFTTKKANMGEIALPNYKTLLLVDFPPLAKDSHQGGGLGNAFMRYAQKARLILVVVDAGGEDPSGDIDMVRTQIELYSQDIAGKPWGIILSKADEAGEVDAGEDLGVPVLSVSASSGKGIDKIVELLVSYSDQGNGEG